VKNLLSCALAIVAAAGAASAQPTIEFLPVGFVLTDLSANGAAGAGNVTGDFSFETFRWTSDGTIVRLGRDTAGPIGVAGGTPDISHDGNRVSASILSDANLMTWGLWDINSGWTQAMPPLPPGGVPLDASYGSAWGLSGDGTTITGLHWGEAGGFLKARASTWTMATGVVSLEQIADRSARVNAANFDGSVVVGWEERGDGVWRPTAWRNGAKFILQDSLAFCEAGAVNSDGTVIVGSAYDEPIATRVSARWVWNGSSYDMTLLGALPMTQPNFGEAFLESVTDDGNFAVGFNRYFQNQSQVDGLVWTPDTGLISGNAYVASLGLTDQLPADTTIIDMVAVSPEGSAVTGLLRNSRTGEIQSFVIYLNNECAGDTNGDGVVNFTDLNTVLAAFGQSGDGLAGDVNGDGVVNFTDLNEVLANFGADCNTP
jgi:hypothetical protein